MRFIELFAGIGGFRYGLESVAGQNKVLQKRCEKVGGSRQGHILSDSGNADPRQSPKMGFNCVWSNEIDKYASQIYRKNYGTKKESEGQIQSKNSTMPESKSPQYRGYTFHCPELYEGDIHEVEAKSIPDHELLVGGFPCQAFSIAGKRKGFNDTRGTLFFEICRIAKVKRPKLLLLENVKGLLNHEGGQTFRTILTSLDELGYDAEWQVLNSKNFGVPQNRERVFIVGHLRGQSRRQVFPIREGKTFDAPVQQQQDKEKARSSCLASRYGQRWTDETYIKKGFKIRRLTPTECERLQGFPDGWTEGISDTQRYKCLGNAVTTNVIRAIGEQIL